MVHGTQIEQVLHKFRHMRFLIRADGTFQHRHIDWPDEPLTIRRDEWRMGFSIKLGTWSVQLNQAQCVVRPAAVPQKFFETRRLN